MHNILGRSRAELRYHLIKSIRHAAARNPSVFINISIGIQGLYKFRFINNALVIFIKIGAVIASAVRIGKQPGQQVIVGQISSQAEEIGSFFRVCILLAQLQEIALGYRDF